MTSMTNKFGFILIYIFFHRTLLVLVVTMSIVMIKLSMQTVTEALSTLKQKDMIWYETNTWRKLTLCLARSWIVVFDRTHTIYVFCQSRGFYYVPWVLISDARSFQALVAMLDWQTHLASMLCWYRSNVRRDEFRLSQAALLWISKVRGYDHVYSRWSAKKTRKSQL